MATKDEIRESRVIRASSDAISKILEDPKRTTDWNPLLKRVSRSGVAKASGRGDLEWSAPIPGGLRATAGQNGGVLTGRSSVLTWKPGREYAWRSTDAMAGITYVGRFELDGKGENTTLTATLSYVMPNAVVAFFNRVAAKRFLRKAVQRALVNIERLAKSERPTKTSTRVAR